MNPKRQFRQLRNDDRWIDLPPTTSHTRTRAERTGGARPRTTAVTTVVAFVIAGVVAIGLWAGLSGLHHTEPASLSPLPSTTLQPRPGVRTPCTQRERLAPIGCSTYTAVAAAGVPGGTVSWTGAFPPSLTLRVLSGKVTALISSGCNGITLPVTLSATTMTPNGPADSTAELCGGARGAQERWVSALFHDTVTYTLNGSDLRLTAGPRRLELTATATTVPTPSPSATATATRATSLGCAPTTATTPAGASTAPIADVDDDGKADTEWAVQEPGGTLRFGITTASGATITGSQGFAGGGDRTFVVGQLANGVVVAITSDHRDSPVYTFSGCAFHTLHGKDLLPGSNASSPFTLYSDVAGGDGGCYGGRLALVHLTPVPGNPNEENAIARSINVSADGLHATLTNSTTTIASNLNIDTDRSRYFHYNGISCGTSKVLRPIYHAK